MYKAFTFVVLICFAQNLFCQDDGYCKTLAAEFNEVLKTNNIRLISRKYDQLSHCCALDSIHIKSFSEKAHQLGYTITHHSPTDYHCYFNERYKSEHQPYIPSITWDELDPKISIKKRFKTEEKLIKKLKIDPSHIATPISYSTEHNIFIVEAGCTYLYDLQSLKTIISDCDGAFDYLGRGYFTLHNVNEPEAPNGFYILTEVKNKVEGICLSPELYSMQILDLDKEHYVFFSEDENYTTTFYSIINDSIIPLYNDIKNVEVDTTLKRMNCLKRDGKRTLFDFKMNVLIDSYLTIEQYWHGDKLYYLAMKDSSSLHLINDKGVVLNRLDSLESIKPCTDGIYIIKRNAHWSVVDIFEMQTILPNHKFEIEYHHPFFSIKKGNIYHLVDDNKRELACHHAQKISILNECKGNFIIVENQYKLKGLYSLQGQEIIPIQYKSLEYDSSTESFIARSHFGVDIFPLQKK